MTTSAKISRNDPCPCGSGKKYKQCCQNKESSTPSAAQNARLLESVPQLFKQAIKAQQNNDLATAESLYQQIIAISPKHSDSLTNLGILALKSGRIPLATELLEKIARLEPSAQNYNNLAQAYNMANRNEDAKDCLHKAIQLNPGYAFAYSNLGSLLSDEHQHAEAIQYFLKSIQLNNRYDTAFGNLSRSLMKQGNYLEAANYYRQAIALNPKEELHYRNLLFCLCFDGTAFPEVYLQEAQKLDHLLTHTSQPYQDWPQLATTPPLRIGLVSGDMRNHPVGYFLENIIQHLDNSRIELYAYDTQNSEDELTARIKPYFKRWSRLTTLTNQQAAQLIHHDGIHILIDLAGHTGTSRLTMFAWKPAPIQVSWLGYFASTGLSCMDYFLADPPSVPAENTKHFREKIWYMPDTRLCFSAPDSNIAGEVQPLPALKNGYVTFGCFQNYSKINDSMLALWADIMRACPGSKLMLKNHQFKDHTIQTELLARISQYGIASERIILDKGSSRLDYFAAYGKVDIMLDTFPYPGGTTTCEALWMGVPTVTLAGNTLLERQGMAMLSCAGLADWVALNQTAYVQLAIQHAHNLPALAQLRHKLRAQAQQSPLMDAPLFATHFTQALEGMWHHYQQNT